MRLPIATAALVLIAAAAHAHAQATPPQKCPVTFSQLMIPLNHENGSSTPEVVLAFTNDTPQKIDRAKFGLILLGEQGAEQAYDQDLSFTAGALPGKVTRGQWKLSLEKFDIQRNGETIYLKSAKFADGTTWKDDGNQRCSYKVDYGPK